MSETGRRIKPARRNGKLARAAMIAHRRKLRALKVSDKPAFFEFIMMLNKKKRIHTSWDRIVGGRS